jgi:tetratricopeptide (TPR) repeat protein
LLLLAAGVWSYFVVRWYIGNTLAEYFDPAEGTTNVANMAVSMAPDDPLTHWRIAEVSKKTLPLDQQGPAIAEYEKAVSLAPYDYRFWMSLGIAHEQIGDPVKAELALKKAVELAPAYTYPHWYLGNLYLRNGRYNEAFAELRRAAEADVELLPQLFSLSWEVYKDDPEALRKAVGEGGAIRAQFALYLLTQKRFEDGLRVWQDISSDEKKQNKQTADAIILRLIGELRHHDALGIWNEIATEKYRVEEGHIFDGSFEEPVSYGAENMFGWHVSGAAQAQIGIDPNKSQSGSRSLRLLFQVRSKLDSINVSQLVPVQRNTEYEFEYYLKTDKLQTASAPQVEIFDANTGAVLFDSPMAPGGTNDWTRISGPIKTSDKTEAIILKIVRVACDQEENPVCPIFGSVWYDDFTLKRRN